MELKVLIIAVIRKGDSILLRKKPEGSPPYKETWYLFGCDFVPGKDVGETVQAHMSSLLDVSVKLTSQFSWATEVKQDIDGITKQFIYLDVLCDYASGDVRTPAGVEKVEWVPIARLAEYDNVPPSVALFKKLGYLQ